MCTLIHIYNAATYTFSTAIHISYLQSHLLERFIHLCEMQRMDSNYSDAMKAIEHALSSLPVTQISTEDCVTSLVGQWVKIKREIINANPEGLSQGEKKTMQRNILQALRQVKGLSDDVKSVYLETELKLYKSNRYSCCLLSISSLSTVLPIVCLYCFPLFLFSHPMHSSELSVIHNLLDLYSHGDKSSELNRARLTIELASISRQYDSTDDLSGSPITLLDEAIALVEPLTTHTHSPFTTVTQSYQHLATAYLWKAICTWEEHMK